MIQISYSKRTGNGLSTCHLCNKYTWDDWCYDLFIYVDSKLLCETLICSDCLKEVNK